MRTSRVCAVDCCQLRNVAVWRLEPWPHLFRRPIKCRCASASSAAPCCHLAASSAYKLPVFFLPTSTVVITVEVWIITPRSADCPPSQRNATTARASHTWWLSVPTRRWRPVLRTNTRLPRPSVQGPRPTSTVQKRRSTPALLHWRGPPPPRRSPTHEGPGPRGGRSPKNNLQGQTIHLWLLFLLSVKVTWSPPTHLIYLTPEKIIIFSYFVDCLCL